MKLFFSLFRGRQPQTPQAVTLQQILEKLNKMSTQLDTLTAEVAKNTTIEASAVALIQGLKSQLDAAGTDPVALKALSDQLGANDDALAAAVAANTAPVQS